MSLWNAVCSVLLCTSVRGRIVLYKRKYAPSVRNELSSIRERMHPPWEKELSFVRKRMFESRMGRLTLTGHTAFHVLTPWEHVMFFRLSRRLSSSWFTCQLVNLLTCLFYLKIIQRLFCVIHKRIKSKSSTLVRILKRRGGNCRCKDIPFILVLQAF